MCGLRALGEGLPWPPQGPDRGLYNLIEEMTTNYAVRVGERLRNVRKQQRLSLQAVEAASDQEFKASVLGAYERGERAISVPRLQRLAKFYNVPVDQLLPRDNGPEPSWSQEVDLRDHRGGGRAEDDRITIDLTRLEATPAPEKDLLSRYLGMIQVQRQDFNGRVLTIRHDDLRAIACLFETGLESMRHRLSELGLRR
jgi:transcriptional regulator with XRE-family HTH domain